MRDRRFITFQRGGTLTPEDHRLFMQWGITCVRHVTHLADESYLPLLESISETAVSWMNGESSVGDARKASMKAVTAARTIEDPASRMVMRAAGHMAATAHMADHALRAASYSLKAVREHGDPDTEERRWQIDQLPDTVRDMVLSAPGASSADPSPLVDRIDP